MSLPPAKKQRHDSKPAAQPAVTISVSESIFDGNNDVHSFSVDISLNGSKVGQAYLVRVSRERPGSFYMSCDDYSGSLESVVSFCCDTKTGMAHHRTNMHGYDTEDGGFLFISSFHITNNKNERDDVLVGATALRKILAHIKGWSLVIYEPEADVQIPSGTNISWSRDDTREQAMEKRAIVDRYCELDARQFFRAGFRQVTPPSTSSREWYHLFAVPSFMKEAMLSDSEAMAVTIVKAPNKSFPPTGVDLEIREVVEMEKMLGISSAMIGAAPPPRDLKALEAQLKERIQKGGAVERSNALHACARSTNDMGVVDILLRLAGSKAKEAINARDENGETPLMIAAESATSAYLMPNPFAREQPTPVGICQQLIDRGADTSVTDSAGLTSLGHMRKYVIESSSFGGSLNEGMARMSALSRVLTPATGPTLADAAVLTVTETRNNRYAPDFDEEDY